MPELTLSTRSQAVGAEDGASTDSVGAPGAPAADAAPRELTTAAPAAPATTLGLGESASTDDFAAKDRESSEFDLSADT